MLPSLSNATEPVLITGEEGTGKELLARSIVTNKNDAFVKLNCVELAPEMLTRLRIADDSQPNGLNNFFPLDTPEADSLIFLLDKINRVCFSIKYRIWLQIR